MVTFKVQRGLSEEVYFKVQNNRSPHSIITNSIHSKRLNLKKQICTWSCSLSEEVMEFSRTPHRAEFKGACLSQMTHSIMAMSHCPQTQRETHSRFTVLKYIKPSKGMGFAPWKLHVKLKIFPKQIERKITVINPSLTL